MQLLSNWRTWKVNIWQIKPKHIYYYLKKKHLWKLNSPVKFFLDVINKWKTSKYNNNNDNNDNHTLDENLILILSEFPKVAESYNYESL